MRTVLLTATAVLLALSTACTPTMEGYGDGLTDLSETEELPAEEPEAAVDDEPETSPVDDEPTDEPASEPEPLECGPNAAEVGGACACDTLYSVCDAADLSIGCCAYGIESFEVTLVAATVLPFKDGADEKPWDWSGFVPSWLQEVIGAAIVYVDEDAADWVDVLDYVYEYAPALLDGSTPPDPYVEVQLNDVPMYQTLDKSDDIEPIWYETEAFTVLPSAELTLMVHDADLAMDDPIGGIVFTQADLQWYAGLGEVTFEGAGGLYDLTLTIEPTE